MMSYNLHPLFVHFPIALLVLYSVIKILPLSKWLPSVAWKQIERALLFFGVLGAFAALLTGDAAEQIAKPNRQLVEMHSTFAAISTFLYGALLVGEIAAMVHKMNALKHTSKGLVYTFSRFLEVVLCNTIFSIVLAIVALASITITGLLGGAMVYGATADPFANSVIHLLGITL